MRTIYLLFPLTKQAKEWIDERVDYELTWAGGIVIEHRYVAPIIEMLVKAGFKRGQDFELYC